MSEHLIIRGARAHNLKNLNLDLPRRALIVITGLSGAGKSSLAFDTIYAEGHRRYVESLSTYARQFLERVEKPDVDYVEGISPAIAIEQVNPVKHTRSTVAPARRSTTISGCCSRRSATPSVPTVEWRCDPTPCRAPSTDSYLNTQGNGRWFCIPCRLRRRRLGRGWWQTCLPKASCG